MRTTPAILYWSVILGLHLLGCESDEERGHIGITFSHLVKNESIILNEMRYENAAGNPYEIKDVEWFISDVTLVSANGREIVLKDEFSHFVSTKLRNTLKWSPADNIPAGKYSQFKFTFGLRGEKNIPGQFPDLPESGMAWPFSLGGENGGYHYMKMDGFWNNNSNVRMPFNFHLGVGQLYNENHEVIEYVQNSFVVNLPIDLTVKDATSQTVQLNMHVNAWFDSTHRYDFNVMGGTTMMNQEAMSMIRSNGYNAFSITLGQN
jgi:hypothetical protein